MRPISGARWPMTAVFTAVLLVFALAACGDSDSGSSDGGASEPVADGSGEEAGDGGDGGGGGSDGTEGGDSMATLTVGADVYAWSGEQMSVCAINGLFPANADFGVPPSQGGEGPWVQFIDRGDGGINFSAVLEGEEYSGTGSGAADEIRSDGFSYTGSMSRSGENVEVELEVSC